MHIKIDVDIFINDEARDEKSHTADSLLGLLGTAIEESLSNPYLDDLIQASSITSSIVRGVRQN